MKRLPRFHEKTFTNGKGKVWTAYYHVVRNSETKKLKWTALGNNKSAALRKWAELESKPVPSEAGTFNSVATEYMKWAQAEVANGELAPRTYQDREKYLKAMKPVFGEHPFDAIRSSHVVKYIDKRSSKHTAGQEMRFLSVLWNWAKARDIVAAPNPVTGIKLPGTGTRTIEVKPQDYWLVHGCGDQMVKDVMELAARLGTRPQEVFGLTWGKVDLQAQPLTVKVWQNKVSGYRLVVADAELEAIIRRLRGDRDKPKGHVLVDEDGKPLNPVGAFRYRFSAARSAAIKKAEEAGVEHQDFQLRDLRPMAGLAMLDAEGMDAARRLLGHTTERMTAAYTTKRRGFVSGSASIKPKETTE